MNHAATGQQTGRNMNKVLMKTLRGKKAGGEPLGGLLKQGPNKDDAVAEEIPVKAISRKEQQHKRAADLRTPAWIYWIHIKI